MIHFRVEKKSHVAFYFTRDILLSEIISLVEYRFGYFHCCFHVLHLSNFYEKFRLKLDRTVENNDDNESGVGVGLVDESFYDDPLMNDGMIYPFPRHPCFEIVVEIGS